MKKTAIAIALAALLSACATGQKDLPVSSLRFDYVTSGGRELGLVRAFDDGAYTALQFNVDLPRELQVFDAKGQPLAYQQVGQTAVLPGLYSPLRVQIGQRAATVEATKELQPTVTQEPLQQTHSDATEAPTAPADQAAEIARLRAELAQAQATIAQLREAAHVQSSSKARQEPNKQLQQEVQGEPQLFSFAFNSADFSGHVEEAVALLPAAQVAKTITVHGYTDSSVSDVPNRRIALARAMAARKFLMEHGIAPEKIKVRFSAAGNFVADNTTAAGRSQNRRVEIRMAY